MRRHLMSWVMAFVVAVAPNVFAQPQAGDADVAILTIDNDPNPDDGPRWMKEKGYTFPVLLDQGYVSQVGITTCPTTWFLDREGRKAFDKVGWSEKLVEEFSWRVEAIQRVSTAVAR
jgi:hypothetical protein